jgi:serine/threonine protein kinase
MLCIFIHVDAHVDLDGVVLLQVGNKFYLVFPLCTGGELYEHVIRKGHFTEYDAAVLMRDLVSALHELHQHDILHLDIKPENILFESDAPDARVKITDFGLSKVPAPPVCLCL